MGLIITKPSVASFLENHVRRPIAAFIPERGWILPTFSNIQEITDNFTILSCLTSNGLEVQIHKAHPSEIEIYSYDGIKLPSYHIRTNIRSIANALNYTFNFLNCYLGNWNELKAGLEQFSRIWGVYFRNYPERTSQIFSGNQSPLFASTCRSFTYIFSANPDDSLFINRSTIEGELSVRFLDNKISFFVGEQKYDPIEELISLLEGKQASLLKEDYQTRNYEYPIAYYISSILSIQAIKELLPVIRLKGIKIDYYSASRDRTVFMILRNDSRLILYRDERGVFGINLELYPPEIMKGTEHTFFDKWRKLQKAFVAVPISGMGRAAIFEEMVELVEHVLDYKKKYLSESISVDEYRNALMHTSPTCEKVEIIRTNGNHISDPEKIVPDIVPYIKMVQVTTTPVVLKQQMRLSSQESRLIELPMGKYTFTISLNLYLPDFPSSLIYLECSATDNRHPHEHYNRLCLGNMSSTFTTLMRLYQLTSAIAIVTEIIHSYNPGDSYFNPFSGRFCLRCGELVLSGVKCWHCERLLCKEHIRQCHSCKGYFCDEDMFNCEKCKEDVCANCSYHCEIIVTAPNGAKEYCRNRMCNGRRRDTVRCYERSYERDTIICSEHRSQCPNCKRIYSLNEIKRHGCVSEPVPPELSINIDNYSTITYEGLNSGLINYRT